MYLMAATIFGPLGVTCLWLFLYDKEIQALTDILCNTTDKDREFLYPKTDDDKKVTRIIFSIIGIAMTIIWPFGIVMVLAESALIIQRFKIGR